MKELSLLLWEAKKHNRTCGIFLCIFFALIFLTALFSDDIPSEGAKITLFVIEMLFAVSLFLFALVPSLRSSKKLTKALYCWIAECFFSDEEFLRGDEVVFVYEFSDKHREVSFTRVDTCKRNTFNIAPLKSFSFLYSSVGKVCVEFMIAYYATRGGAENAFVATKKEVTQLVADGKLNIRNTDKNKFILWEIVQ